MPLFFFQLLLSVVLLLLYFFFSFFIFFSILFFDGGYGLGREVGRGMEEGGYCIGGTFAYVTFLSAVTP